MRAIVLKKFGGLDSLLYQEIPDPEPIAGHVVIEVKAFGINHAEMHMRRGEWHGASTPPPLLGQHTNEILTRPLRMPAAKVEKHRAAGVG